MRFVLLMGVALVSFVQCAHAQQGLIGLSESMELILYLPNLCNKKYFFPCLSLENEEEGHEGDKELRSLVSVLPKYKMKKSAIAAKAKKLKARNAVKKIFDAHQKKKIKTGGHSIRIRNYARRGNSIRQITGGR